MIHRVEHEPKAVGCDVHRGENGLVARGGRAASEGREAKGETPPPLGHKLMIKRACVLVHHRAPLRTLLSMAYMENSLLLSTTTTLSLF